MRALRGPKLQMQPLHCTCTRTELEPGLWLDGHQQKPNWRESRPAPPLQAGAALHQEGCQSSALPCSVADLHLAVQGHMAVAAGHCQRCETAARCSSSRSGHCHGTSVLGESTACAAQCLPTGSGVQVGCKVETVTRGLKCRGGNRNQATTHGKGSKTPAITPPVLRWQQTLAVFCFSHNPFEMINRMSHEVVLLWKLSQ